MSQKEQISFPDPGENLTPMLFECNTNDINFPHCAANDGEKNNRPFIEW